MHWFVMSLRRYAEFKGRSARTEYFVFHVLLGFLLAICCGTLFVLEPSLSTLQLKVSLAVLSIFFGLMVVPAFSLEVRRFHDLGLSGWYVLINLLPLVGRLVVLLFMIRKGNDGPNRFGGVPTTKKAGST